MVLVETTNVVGCQDNHCATGCSAVRLELLDDRASLVCLLVKDHILQASFLNEPSNLDFSRAVPAMDDEYFIAGRCVVGLYRLWLCGRLLAQLDEIFFERANGLPEQR